jgi:hypothetical protein
MVRRLFWVGVGVALTVVVLRKGRAVAEEYLPQGTTELVDGVTRLSAAVRTARAEFSAGMAEREDELRRELVGDADLDALRAERPQRTAALREAFDSRTGRTRKVPSDWAGPTEDPDDDDGYTFF